MARVLAEKNRILAFLEGLLFYYSLLFITQIQFPMNSGSPQPDLGITFKYFVIDLGITFKYFVIQFQMGCTKLAIILFYFSSSSSSSSRWVYDLILHNAFFSLFYSSSRSEKDRDGRSKKSEKRSRSRSRDKKDKKRSRSRSRDRLFFLRYISAFLACT